MNSVQTDPEIEELVWSIFYPNLNLRDSINYIQHAYNRAAQREEALWLAETNWGNDRAIAHFPTPKINATLIAARNDTVIHSRLV